jgi:hypothetical protein
MNRRMFVSMLFFRPEPQPAILQVAVIETFDLPGKTAAILVHHANESDRESFAAWLRGRTGSTVRIRTKSGTETTGTIFRVRLCFGRALIVPDQAIHVGERDILSMLG